MMRLELHVPGRPATKGSTSSWRHPSTGQIVTQQDSRMRLDPWTRTAVLQAQVAMSRAGIGEEDKPALRGPVQVFIEATFSRPMSHYINRDGRRLRADAPEWHDVYPDGDKLARAVLDAMTKARVWKDDGQAAVHRVEKRWADPGEGEGVTITITGLGGERE